MSASRTAAVVVTWEGGEATAGCVASLLAQTRPPAEILVVDNASSAAERTALRARFGAEPCVRLLLLDENRQFAGGLNAGAAAAGPDVARLLFLNNDTRLEPDALARLEDTLDATPGAGIAGPRVMDVASRTVLTAGERHGLWLLCVPRTLLRYRRPPTAPYPVTGIMGCALLATRACWRATGGFSEEIAVYYEDVDFCLAARARGYGLVLEPRAVFWHDGIRGFARGLTPWAAFLKARNPWLLMRRRGARAAWLGFVPTYAALLASSAALWALRGRGDVVWALGRGVVAGMRTALGAPAGTVAAPRRVA